MSIEAPRYEISQTAYIKLVLHSLNHLNTPVNSVLLGRELGGTTIVQISDAVPLFHSQIGLLPPLEFALITIEAYCESQGLSIVGYFHGNERFNEVEIGSVAKNIGDHIHRYFSDAAMLLLDNKKLEALLKGKGNDQGPVIQLFTKDASKNWKQAVSDGRSRLILKEPLANVVLVDYIASEKWKDMVDFDDHYHDISKDWRNLDLFK